MSEFRRKGQEPGPFRNYIPKISEKGYTDDQSNRIMIQGNTNEEAKQILNIQKDINNYDNTSSQNNTLENGETTLETLETFELKISSNIQKNKIKKELEFNSEQDINSNLNENNLNNQKVNLEINLNTTKNVKSKNNEQFCEIHDEFPIPYTPENSKKMSSSPFPASLEEIKNKYYEGIDLKVIPEDEDEKRPSTMKQKDMNKFNNNPVGNNSNNILDLISIETNRILPEKSFKIIDKSTGTIYDLRKQDEMIEIHNKISILSNVTPIKRVKAWDSWWKKKKSANKHLFLATDKNSVSEVIDVLNYSKYKELTADVNAKGIDDWTALHIAVNENYFQILQALIKNGANIEANTSLGRTPLHLAALRGHRKIFEILLSVGAKINPQDKEGNTPLHFLSEHGHADLLKLFLIKNPDISIKNNLGETALKVAANIEIRNILMEFDSIPENNQNYDRSIKHGMLIHDGRSDVIKGYLYRMQKNTYPKNNEDTELKNAQDAYPEKTTIKSNNKFIQIREYVKKQFEKSDNSIDYEIDYFNPSNLNPVYLLGKGSFGEVYLVERKIDKKQFALKVLLKKKVFSQNLVRYAKTERNVLCFTHHPFIVRLFSAFQTSDRLFMVMEYCPGGDLGKIITRERRIPEERAKVYAAEVILALEDLHKRDIIFRDLKPENVVIDADGHAKLTDFGLSKEGVMDNISAQSFCGSIAYLAPEMLKKCGHGKSVDWYLLGALIYEMLTGKPPFYTNQKDLLFQAIVSAPAKFPPTMSEEAKNLLKGVVLISFLIKSIQNV